MGGSEHNFIIDQRKIFYSQNFEDVILDKIFYNHSFGFYIDIGAYDPNEISVTKYFYDRGWHGINIDPLKSSIDKFKNSRPRDINLNYAISSSPHVFIEKNGPLTKIHKNQIDLNFKKIKAITGKKLVKTYLKKNTAVNFLKIDTEGSELDILETFDFNEFRPIVILVETVNDNKTNKNEYSIQKILKKNNYFKFHFDGLNTYYIDHNKKTLLDHVDYLGIYHRDKPFLEYSYKLKYSRTDVYGNKNIIINLVPMLPSNDNGGIKIFTLYLIDQLLEKNLNISIIGNNRNYSYLKKIYSGVKIYNYDQTFDRFKLALFFVKKNFSFLSPLAHVIIFSDLIKNKFLLNLIRSHLPKTVTILCDTQHIYYPQYFTKNEIQHRNNYIQKTLDYSSSVFTISEDSKSKFEQHFNFVNQSFDCIYPIIPKIYKLKQNKKNKNYIFYPANSWKHKNHLNLITAFINYRINNKQSDLKLFFLTNDIKKLKLLIPKKFLNFFIFKKSIKDHQAVLEIMKGSKGLIFPSIFEGFGIPVYEACKLSIPVVCSNLNVFKKIYNSYLSYFDPFDLKDIENNIKKLDKNTIHIVNNKNIIDQIEFQHYQSLDRIIEYLTS